MIFLEEKDQSYVFACQACRDVNRKLSVQVMTAPAMKRAVRQGLERQGKLLTAPPPVREPVMRARAKKRLEWSGRASKDGRVELVHYQQQNGEIRVQLAIDGVVAPMMDDHVASREDYPSEEEYFARLAEASQLMIHLYGDARNPLSVEETEARQQQAF